MAALMHAALLYWTQRGGDRTVAKSSWLPRGATPRSQLEALALGVLRAHVPDETPRDAVAGAEYWVQIRQRRDGGLGFHFDKDERAHAERGEWHHPMLASATYLTHGGAPLAIFDTTSDGQGPVRRAWLVSPQRGRHVAFLGDRLHGVPAELAPENILKGINCAKNDPGTTRQRPGEPVGQEASRRIAGARWRGVRAICPLFRA